MYGDPCYGTEKYVHVEFMCMGWWKYGHGLLGHRESPELENNWKIYFLTLHCNMIWHFLITVICFIPGVDPINLVFFTKKEFLHFFAAKLGHFIINYFFPICKKYSSLIKKNGKRRKKSFLRYFAFAFFFFFANSPSLTSSLMSNSIWVDKVFDSFGRKRKETSIRKPF